MQCPFPLTPRCQMLFLPLASHRDVRPIVQSPILMRSCLLLCRSEMLRRPYNVPKASALKCDKHV
jgi:hypothetical protein